MLVYPHNVFFFTFHANTTYNPDIRSFCHYTAIIPRQIPLHYTHMNRPLIPQINKYTPKFTSTFAPAGR
ncbi:hypothetical protein BHE74_00050114 [Ensete ventricosum]|uniref:Uncharacterized protein n=1 Tax=Ensete ventricosum TaxID=4639 RepID=A0A444EY54_ENSVE|nr:hypothetical protein B296_00051703 [Ensete ventricosum]RWW15269.1 hypothetical protein GW17_00020901 [Ensete ventricosum]RWW44153.1 hypothetical protein BHE74_00050114 [Ensete ventricosum]RZS15329.1 hypothetical protein BHM03_00047143 [Ensete ventricosum]